MVNALRHQGLEVSIAKAPLKAGTVDIAAGDYIVRADQPYRTLADMYFSVQNYPVANPRAYDDTGWTMQYLRNVKLSAVNSKSLLDLPMTLLTADAKVQGVIENSGDTLIIDHTTDNTLMAFRFRFPAVKMLAAEDDFDAAGTAFHAGAFIIPSADRSKLEPAIQELGLSAHAVAAVPSVKTHELDVPALAMFTPGRARKMKGGSAPRSMPTAFLTLISPIKNCASPISALNTTSFCFRTWAAHPNRK